VLTVLHSGIDTLEASFKGTLEKGLVEQLEKFKKLAQKENAPQALPVGDLEFAASSTGVKPWPYLLTHEDLHLRLSGAKSIPTVSARLSAIGLSAYGHEGLYALAESLARELGAVPAGLSRLDVCVDFQGHEPELEEMRSAICHASFRPIYPSVASPETYVFGKGQVVVRIYNKTAELQKSGKEWVQTVWKQHADYDSEKPVWRFELQLRRETLRALGCETAKAAFENLPRLLGFGLDWVSPRVPLESNLSRCPVQPWWEELRTASLAGAALARVKEDRRAASFKRLVPQAVGLLVSGAAFAKESDFEKAMDLQADAMRSYIARKGIPFEERVRRRQLEVNR
jgi:hypothetical protein